MRRGIKTVLCFLALLMAMSIVMILPCEPQTVRAAGHLEATIKHSIELYGDLGLEYRVKLNSSDSYSNVYLRLQRQKFSGSGSSYTWETVDLKNYTRENDEYVFRYYGLNSTEMPNLVRATVYATLGSVSYVSDTDETSISSYCLDLLKMYSGGSTQKEKTLCALLVDLLNYGAAAQKYFGFNVSNLANAKLTSNQRALGSSLPTSFTSCYAYTPLSGSTCSIDHFEMDNVPTTVLNAMLRFTSNPDSNTYVEVSYTSATGASKVVKKYFSDFTYNSSTKLYKVAIPEIKSPDYATRLSIVVKKGSTTISGKYTYSVESYIEAVVAAASGSSSASDTAWAFVQNLMAYSTSARKYFGVSGSVNTPTPTKKPTISPTKKPTDPPTPTKKPTNPPTPTKKPTLTKKPTTPPTPTTATGSLATYKNSKYTKNMPQAVIVIPASATSEEKYAANMLQLYISREDGYSPKIITDATSQGSQGFEISVGKTNRPHGTAAYSSDGSYSIKSYTNGISILGVGKRGTIDGSAKFLSACGGYFWLSFEDGYITNQTHFKYETNISIDYKRPFLFTDIDVSYGKLGQGENRMFSISAGLNGYFVNSATGNQAGAQNWYLYDPETAHYPSGLHPGQVHTLLAEYFNDNDFKQHPEWFCQWDGQRVNKQLCLSNQKVWDHILEHVFKILKSSQYDKNAPMQILCLGQADNEYYCQCSACLKYNSTHEFPDINGGTCGMYESAHYVELCNYVSKAVKAAGYKNVYIDMLAYTWNYRPPKNVTIDDHVIVRFAAINRCYAHGCNDSECVRNEENGIFLDEWARLCREGGANLWIWDYNANWYTTIFPYPNIEALTHDIAYYKSIGVTGIYLQSNDRHSDCNTEFGDLRNYLGTVLLENPNADVAKETEFFLQQFYGASAPYVKEYVDIMVNQAQHHQCGDHPKANPYYFRDKMMSYDAKPTLLFCNQYGTSEIWYNGKTQIVDATEFMDAHNRMTDSDIARCEELSKLAMNAVANDAEHLYRTERTFLSWRLVKSCLKVYEFKNASTYVSENRKLYNDLVQKFKLGTFSLIFREIPEATDAIMAKNPGEWPVK